MKGKKGDNKERQQAGVLEDEREAAMSIGFEGQVLSEYNKRERIGINKNK